VSGQAGQIDPELRSTPLVFVPDLEAPELDDSDRSHLERSLRVRAGEPIIVADGAGRYRPARMGSTVALDGPIVVSERLRPRLTVGFALVKGDRSDLVVQKLTELGIDTVIPLHSQRSIVRWDDNRAEKNLARHGRIAREAAMQAKNLWLPTIRPLTSLTEFLHTEPSAILGDPGGAPIGGETTAIAIGPEGGFSPGEIALRRTVRFPGRVLRTETAAIAAGVLLAAGRQNR
jgi:16S rRNA (uracil1498-N3)-methyltransferase